MAPPPAPADPLAVARGLADAADLGAWLSGQELAQLLGVAPGTVRSWSTGHRPRRGVAGPMVGGVALPSLPAPTAGSDTT